MEIPIKFGGYQEPASIHNRAAAHFGELLEQKLGDRVTFELIGSILKLGRPSGDLVPMVERGELSFCYMSTVRFSRTAPELQLLELPFVVEPIASDVKEFVEQIGGDRFQAQDNPLTNIYNFGVHRYHRYITLSGHFWGASAIVCNAAHYRSWPTEVQSTVDAAAREATAYQRQLAAAEDAEIMAKLDPAKNDVIRLTDGERAAFMRAVQPVLEKYRRQLDPKLFAFLES